MVKQINTKLNTRQPTSKEDVVAPPIHSFKRPHFVTGWYNTLV
jgi:hypothetical protein